MDAISCALTSIKNSTINKNKSVDLPYLKTTWQLVKILKNEGFIESFSISENSNRIIVILKYEDKYKKPLITNLKQISKPGRRVYVNWKQVPQLLGGLGILILSTSRGIITNKQARSLKIGGELLCSIW